jgi:hypothetical protein
MVFMRPRVAILASMPATFIRVNAVFAPKPGVDMAVFIQYGFGLFLKDGGWHGGIIQ